MSPLLYARTFFVCLDRDSNEIIIIMPAIKLKNKASIWFLFKWLLNLIYDVPKWVGHLSRKSPCTILHRAFGFALLFAFTFWLIGAMPFIFERQQQRNMLTYRKSCMFGPICWFCNALVVCPFCLFVSYSFSFWYRDYDKFYNKNVASEKRDAGPCMVYGGCI